MQQSEINAPINPPKVGDKVFLPELQVWGEIVEFYDENKGLITRVRAMVNGKPTYVDVTNLIVDLAEAVRVAVPLVKKIIAALKSLCQKIGLCKKPQPVATAAIPDALILKLKEVQARAMQYGDDNIDALNELEKLKKYLP